MADRLLHQHLRRRALLRHAGAALLAALTVACGREDLRGTYKPQGMATETIRIAALPPPTIASGDGTIRLVQVVASTFRGPVGIALDASDHLYVTDTARQQVQQFDRNGRLRRVWGTVGSDAGQFVFTEGTGSIAVDADNAIWIGDATARIQAFDATGRFRSQLGGFGVQGGQFGGEVAIASARWGALYLADRNNDRVQALAPAGQVMAMWGTRGNGPGQFNAPHGLAVSDRGWIFVADGTHRVQVFAPDGSFLYQWGSGGTGAGEFNLPVSVALDKHGRVYVADRENHRVQQFTVDGRFIRAWGRYGTGLGEFASPMGIAIDTAGEVYVADYGNDRVQRFRVD